VGAAGGLDTPEARVNIPRDSAAHRALGYLDEQGPQPADMVGVRVWPERTKRPCANQGGGDYAAQMLLGRLKKAGYVRHAWSEGSSLWEITPAGRKKITKNLDPARRRGTVKKFAAGQAVEIQREVGEPWELATYQHSAADQRGWHVVQIPNTTLAKVFTSGQVKWLTWTFGVPTRRIRPQGVR
jgi:hypothetical protein